MRICVFCGSSPGTLPSYEQVARQFGQLLAEQGIGVVYGGASIGLMGAVAEGALSVGGEVIGVIPQALDKREVAHRGLSQLHVVGSMHERKALMAELSDGFVALPGGIGTLEELFEIWTWAQLGLHQKPCALLNVHGFYDGLTQFLDHVGAQGFLRPHHRDVLIVEQEAERLVTRMFHYRPPAVTKWIDKGDT